MRARKRLKGKGKSQMTVAGFFGYQNKAGKKREAELAAIDTEHTKQRALRAVASEFGKTTPLEKALIEQHIDGTRISAVARASLRNPGLSPRKQVAVEAIQGLVSISSKILNTNVFIKCLGGEKEGTRAAGRVAGRAVRMQCARSLPSLEEGHLVQGGVR